MHGSVDGSADGSDSSRSLTSNPRAARDRAWGKRGPWSIADVDRREGREKRRRRKWRGRDEEKEREKTLEGVE